MIGCFTGASTAPELDGALAEVDGISFRMPYQSDPIMRNKINAGVSGYADIHLSHSGPQTWAGFLGKLDVAVIEVTAITADGELVPSSSVGNNTTWLEAPTRSSSRSTPGRASTCTACTTSTRAWHCRRTASPSR